MVLQTYYKALLGLSSMERSPIDPQVINRGNTLPVDLQMKLYDPFSEKDIQEAIFLIPNLKSPGPDEFSSGFFKSTWHITGTLVCNVIQQFFQSSRIPPFLGQTKLILLPKVPNPTQAKDFRPISYCSVIYKCIAKLICSRLKEVLAHLVQQPQGAFVKGRELLFNVLICQDIVRGYTRKGISPRCIMKINLHKAFDSVHWGFI